MELKDYTPVVDKNGEIRAVFAAADTAELWIDGEQRRGHGFKRLAPVTLTLPDAPKPPPRSSDVVARELADAIMRHEREPTEVTFAPVVALKSEYRALAPQPPAPRRARWGRIGSYIYLWFPRTGGGEWALRSGEVPAGAEQLEDLMRADLKACMDGGVA